MYDPTVFSYCTHWSSQFAYSLANNIHNKRELQSHRTMESKRLAFCPFLFKYSVVIVISNLGLKHRIDRSIGTEDIDSDYVNLNESSAKPHSENEWHGAVNTGNPWENCSSPNYLCKRFSVHGCKWTYRPGILAPEGLGEGSKTVWATKWDLGRWSAAKVPAVQACEPEFGTQHSHKSYGWPGRGSARL